MGEASYLEIDWYDPVNRNFAATIYGDDGGVFSLVANFSGNTNSWNGEVVVAGKRYFEKGTDILAADSMSFARKAEISVDGKNWVPWFEAVFTKARQPASKK